MGTKTQIPKEFTIKDIVRINGPVKPWIYASLYDANGKLLMCANLEYIYKQLLDYGVEVEGDND